MIGLYNSQLETVNDELQRPLWHLDKHCSFIFLIEEGNNRKKNKSTH